MDPVHEVTLSPAFAVAMTVSVVLVFAMPFGAHLLARRRLGTPGKAVLVGLATWTVPQLLVRIPLVAIAQLLLMRVLTESPAAQWAWLATLSFTAGLFEEGGRWLGFRFLLRDRRDFAAAVGLGVGHGGVEAILLVGCTQAATLGLLLLLAGGGTEALPMGTGVPMAEQLGAAMEAPLTPLLAAWERAGSLALHIALSVMVARGFTRGRALPWLGGAMLLHGLANFVTIAYLQLAGGGMVHMVVAEVIVSAFGFGALAWVFGTRRPEDEPALAAPAPEPEGPPVSG